MGNEPRKNPNAKVNPKNSIQEPDQQNGNDSTVMAADDIDEETSIVSSGQFASNKGSKA